MLFQWIPPTPAEQVWPLRPAAALVAAAATAATGWAVTACRLRTRTRQLHRARRDPVTGLLTRAAWEPAAQIALRHHGSVLGLVDLDGFKSVNDTYGHEAGDQVLRAVATRLKTTLGVAAVVGRLGGDELVFVTRLACLDQLDTLLSTLTAPIPVTGAGVLRIGVSLGVTALGSTVALPDALAAADLAMYEAKTRHGGWRLHPPSSSPALCLPRPRRPRVHQLEGSEVMNR